MECKKIRLSTALILLFVAATAQAETWYFDFGSATQQTTPNYNNITNPGVQTISGLINAGGQSTGAVLSITLPFNATNSTGTGSPALDVGFPASATRDNFYGSNPSASRAQLEFAGLDPVRLYSFFIFASRMNVADNRQTEYKVSGENVQTTYLDAAGNASSIVSVSDIRPTQNGTITIDISAGPENTSASKFFYLSAMKMVSSGTSPCEPNDDPTLDDKLSEYPLPAPDSAYTMGHYLYRPIGYSQDSCKTWPLLVFLHGVGEIKRPLASLNAQGLNSPGYQIKSGVAYSEGRPFLNGLILQPQTKDGWTAANIDAMIQYVKSRVRVDEDRIYITGLSLGGGGTWSYAASASPALLNPAKIAAIVPIAGTQAANTTIHGASHIPIWAFHNYRDSNDGNGLAPETELFRCKTHTHVMCTVEHIDRMFPFASTRVLEGYETTLDMTASLSGIASLPTTWTWGPYSSDSPDPVTSTALFTIFSKGVHDAWTQAYNTKPMWNWLYNQKREPTTTVRFSAPSTISPSTVVVNTGSTVVVSAKFTAGSPVSEVWVDLKSLGGPHDAKMTLATGTTYKLTYTLPTSGLTLGKKGVGIVAIDESGKRILQFVTITIKAE